MVRLPFKGKTVRGIAQPKEPMENEVKVIQSCPTLCDPMDCTHQATLSMEFSRQEYWSGQPFPSPGEFPNPGIEPVSLNYLLHQQAGS